VRAPWRSETTATSITATRSAAPKAGLRLKPDWSPVLARYADLIGRAWIVRADWARRRVLVRCYAVPSAALDSRRPPAHAAKEQPCATIVIPTRDRVDLQRACVESLIRIEGRADFEAIVVDNGSDHPSTLAYLNDIQRDCRFRVLQKPGH
jgi:hypothetical protein